MHLRTSICFGFEFVGALEAELRENESLLFQSTMVVKSRRGEEREEARVHREGCHVKRELTPGPKYTPKIDDLAAIIWVSDATLPLTSTNQAHWPSGTQLCCEHLNKGKILGKYSGEVSIGIAMT